ncbi:HTTM domain-containing protein [Fulvivirga kasyanovii]|uniref:HTTM domain-containing protein n=1 Tax=Fulvivirga kasyanovii TaxID=396812 RepID=A0ABW9RX54_9BACT|nr:HTTM domain-containing protein [Fulvivirga kasyanovii]MTI28802.1 HTTM domain-containing protein [Fulvivirga kasyanovii]
MTFTQKLFRPVDNSPLILFRIVFGLLIFLEAWGAILTGWVRRAFIEPQYTFPFIDFSWLQPLPGYGMYIHYIIMGIAGLMVMFGFYYRLGIGIYTIMWSGVYFMQKTNYNNHYYLLVLMCMLMCLVPAHRYASIDAKRHPEKKSLTCPQWCLWIFAIQTTIVYIYASVAKMYPDWIAAKPISIWFDYKSDYFLVGPLLAKEWFQHSIAYGGILFDLLIAPGLIWKRTRKYAFIASIFFHLFNSIIFQVGVFPYMGIALGVFFFEPEVIRRIFFKRKPVPEYLDTYKPRIAWVYIVGLYFVMQILLPLRHWLYPGNVHWTEEGHRLSWHMMLRVKSGYVFFKVVDPKTGREWRVNPNKYLTYKQSKAIASRPDMCWQFVQILKEDYADKGYPEVAIYAVGKVSLNGREQQPLYDESIDLAKVEWKRFRHSDWLLDMK